ncbi:MAG: FAD-dependent monooxygenase [Akkermansiaceae bacterium]|nr:FAD-dependent monooxygenase [Akkermansiaceae bacterium]
MKRKITIVGGGLAGLSLAVALRNREVAVTVLEAGTYPRHRVCGEFISGVSAETLATLGINDLFDRALSHRTIAWHDRGRLLLHDRLKNPAIGISRHHLDERLRDRVVALGGDVRTSERAHPAPQDGLVWAAGRRPRNGPWVGLKAHVRHTKLAADLEMHAGTNGYAGVAAVEDGWTNVCGLFRVDRSIQAHGAALLPAYLEDGGNPELAATLKTCEWREGSFSAMAGFELGRQTPLPSILCLGDAESMIPPFTGNGMSMAFEAAECALAPLVAWAQGEMAWQKVTNSVRARLTQKFSLRLKVAGALHPILLESGGRSVIHQLASAHLLPFQTMLALTR